jgi:hypothetical protein
MNIINEGRIGKFSLGREVLIRLAQDGIGAIFRGMIVLETQMSFVEDRLMYTAAHPDFRPLAKGEVVPTYRCTGYEVGIPDGGCFVKWEELK